MGEDYAVAHAQAFSSFEALSQSLPSPLTLSAFVTTPASAHTLFSAPVPCILTDVVHICEHTI